MTIFDYFHAHWVQAVICILLSYSLLSGLMLTVRVVARGWPPKYAATFMNVTGPDDETDDEQEAE